MGAMDKFLGMMKIQPDSEDEYYYDEEEPEEEPVASKPKTEQVTMDRRKEKEPSKVTSMGRTKSKSSSSTDILKVCVINPTSFEEAREVTETLLEMRPVILNLTGLDTIVAQRIIDFSCGSCYAIDGNLQQISNNIFILTPKGVEIAGDFPEENPGQLDVIGFN